MAEEQKYSGFEVAIIGMSGVFPGARDIRQFWENLVNGVESVSFFSDDDAAGLGIPPELLDNPNFVRSRGGVVDDIDCFDAAFFQYTPVEAEVMDPQIRVFHQCAWNALEDAGYDPFSYQGLIGLYAGASRNLDWQARLMMSGKMEDLGDFAASHLADRDYLNSRIAYQLNLKGPVVFLHTACSTSLVAIHLACRGLLMGECDMALAGGVSLSTSGAAGYIYREGMIPSPDGHCRPFDVNAKGTVRGNGAGVVVLRRLKHALAAGDHMYSLIKGSAINNDGNRKVGFTAPSVEGQAEVVQTVQHIARVEPDSISYIETHGTGTVLGDPIEIEALKKAFNIVEKNHCRIGSVKSNIGHLDTAAGVTGVIKTALALYNRLIPPSINFKGPNPRIDFAGSPFVVNRELCEWTSNGNQRRAGVSSFGIGGTNAHLVLEEAPVSKTTSFKWNYQLLVLSAHTEEALQKRRDQLIAYLGQQAPLNLADMCYTLQVGRHPLPYRFSAVCSRNFSESEILSKSGSVSFVPDSKKRTPVETVFMFPGQGAQYSGMGAELYEQAEIFRRELDRCISYLDTQGIKQLKDILYPSGEKGEDAELINLTSFTQPVLFSFEYALARQLMAWGIKPTAMIGHSIGEYVAACIAGVFSLEDALRLVALRGQFMQDCPKGEMLSVAASVSQLESLLGTDICLAAINSPSRTVISGSGAELEMCRKQLDKNGIESTSLHTSHAFHSHLMEPMLKPFIMAAEKISFNKPQIPFISNLSGTWIGHEEATDPNYWARHARETVNFSAGAIKLFEMENPVFIEVGPGRTLKTFMRQHITGKEKCIAIDLIKHPRASDPGDRYFLEGLGKCWGAGISVDWNAFQASERRKRVPLPGYPFAKKRYWLESGDFEGAIEGNKATTPARKQEMEDFFYIPLWHQTPLPEKSDKKNRQKERFIVFVDDSSLAQEIVALLFQTGGEVISVRIGSAFRKVDAANYTISPADAGHYRRLWRKLGEENSGPLHVVHLWLLGLTEGLEKPFDRFDFDSGQDTGYYSLMHFFQAVVNSSISNSLTLTVVSNQSLAVTGGESLALSPAPLIGFLRVIPQELPGVKTKHIDVNMSISKGYLAQSLVNDILSERCESTVAYRNKNRYIQVFQPTNLGDDSNDKIVFRQNGVYLITGGLGKIGLELAGWFSKTLKANLALVTRSSLPPRDQWEHLLLDTDDSGGNVAVIRRIMELEKIGGRLSVYTADVSDFQQMEAIIRDIELELGPIAGVIHAAGVTSGKSAHCMLGDLTKTDVLRQFQAKVYGVMVLDRIFNGKALDFCILMSSLAANLGGLGFSAYAAGNRFMDSFAQKKHLEDSPFPWISINWDGWNFSSPQELSLEPHEGIAAFIRIVNWQNQPVVAVSTWDMAERIRQWIEMEVLRQPANGEVLEENYANSDIGYIQQTVIEIWQRLLGIEDIAANDHFFELGGDSLKIMTVASNIHKRLHVEVPIAELFDRPTPESIARYIQSTAKAAFVSIQPLEKRDYYDVSHAQRRLWVVDQFSEEQGAYKVSLSYALENLDVECFQKSFEILVRRHEILRTTFIEVEGQPRQRVHEFEHSGIRVETIDYSSERDGENQAVSLAQMDYNVNFDLVQGPLVRAKLVRISQNRFLFLLTLHHIIADAWSVDVLQNELSQIYEAIARGEDIPLKSLDIHYKDYSAWQNSQMGQEAFRHHKRFWMSLFDSGIPIMDIKTDFSRPPVKSIKGNNVMMTLDLDLGKTLRSMCQRHECSLFMLLISSVAVLLYYYSGQEDLVIGSPIAGRDHGDLDEQIGFYLNMLPLRITFTDSDPFVTLLENVKELAINAFQHQAYPFDLLINDLEVSRDSSRSPLFDVVVQVLNTAAGAQENSSNQSVEEGAQMQNFQVELKQSKYDLVFNFSENAGYVTLNLEYNIDLFTIETVKLMVRRFEKLLQIVTGDEGIRLVDIHLEEEYSIPMIQPVRR